MPVLSRSPILGAEGRAGGHTAAVGVDQVVETSNRLAALAVIDVCGSGYEP
jgi:hypothetical protein